MVSSLRIALILLLSLAGGPPAVAEGPGAPKAKPAKGKQDAHARVRGITVSCQTWGWEWGSDEMLPTLDRVKKQGGNWVAIHPYARIRNDGSVRAFRMGGEEAPRWLSRPIAEAHKRGLKILIKPHLAYWGSGFSWRGAITFKNAAAWERFFSGYQAWVVRLARMCSKADAFAVGTELGGTVQHEQRWRTVIREVRKVSKVPLTYAANWDRYQKVPFWDAVDVIGIQAYFPVVHHKRPPSSAELKAGWARILKEVGTFARKNRKKVVFSELGYDRSQLAAYTPWKSGPRWSTPEEQKKADDVQERCMAAALRAIQQDATVVGAFLWKMFPGRARGDFRLTRPELAGVVRKAWQQPKKAAPARKTAAGKK